MLIIRTIGVNNVIKKKTQKVFLSVIYTIIHTILDYFLYFYVPKYRTINLFENLFILLPHVCVVGCSNYKRLKIPENIQLKIEQIFDATNY